MEKRGAINQYEPYRARWGVDGSRNTEPVGGRVYYTVNLANGVTPFMKMFDGKEHNSTCYRLDPRPNMLTVSHCWYRPAREEFDALDKWGQDHVLNGGLCFGEVGKVKQLPDDPVEIGWDYERFQSWALETYGRRLPAGETR